MPISFNQVPSAARVPFMFVEFDTSRAQQGPSLQVYKALIMGQRLSTGTKPQLQFDLVTSADQAKKFYGNGSMLAQMVERFLAVNKVTSVTCVSIDDLVAGVKATGTFTITGPATASGTLYAYAGGRRYAVGVTSGDTATAIATNLAAAITADTDRVVDAVSALGVVTATARHKGLTGNEIDLRVNYYQGEALPTGVAVVVVAMSGGTGNPLVSDIIAVLPEDQFNVIANPWLDAVNLSSLETELADRFGPIRQNDGVAFSAKRESYANLITLGNGRNSPHNSIMGMAGPHSPWEWASEIAGSIALNGSIDPARPFTTLSLPGLLAPKDSEQFSFSERNLLLFDGISTYKVDGGGIVRLERMITTFQTNALSAPDTSLLDVNTLLTLSYLRYDFRTQFQLKYPRHKLASDGNRFGPGQAIITPSVAKAQSIAIFRGWENLGLVENVDQFKRDLIVERSATDPNRLDFLLSPDLINQFLVGGSQIAFLL